MKVFNDISLVARVAAFDDKRAFDAIVRKYQESVRRFFMTQTLGDEALSDDLAQETFIKAYTHIGHFRGLSGFSTWLYRIAYRVLLDDVRARRHTEDIDGKVADCGVSARRQPEDGHLPLYADVKARRTCVCNPATCRGTAHRTYRRDNGNARRHG